VQASAGVLSARQKEDKSIVSQFNVEQKEHSVLRNRVWLTPSQPWQMVSVLGSKVFNKKELYHHVVRG
jgi:hypothetical protein